jgi:predicted RNase H-like HicB family nuclease
MADKVQWEYPKDSRCYVLDAVLVPEAEGGYSAYADNLPGCVSQGETEAEAVSNLKEAFAALIESYNADNQPIPWAQRCSGVIRRQLSVED